MERGFLRRAIEHGGVERRYAVYVPDSYDPAVPSPAILFLHGRGEEGTDGWSQVAVGLGPAVMLEPRRWPFLIVFPQKPRDRAGWLEYGPLALGALDRAREEWSVDPSRVYLTGVSMGGFGTWTLPPRHPGLFAALAPVCGGGDPEEAPDLVDVPIWAFHGSDDRVVPLRHSQRMVQAVRAAGGDPRLTVYPGVGHASWEPAYRTRALPEWLLEQHGAG